MARIIEHAIESHFSSVATPSPHPLQLQPNPVTGYGWRDVADSLVVPKEVSRSLEEASVAECALLLLHSMLMRELPSCSSLGEEMKALLRIMQWCTAMKPK